jgi:hypothetical protein
MPPGFRVNATIFLSKQKLNCALHSVSVLRSRPAVSSFAGVVTLVFAPPKRARDLAFDLRNNEPEGSRPVLLRKEVIQPQVPLRLPCYDFIPVTAHTLDGLADGFGYKRLP